MYPAMSLRQGAKYQDTYRTTHQNAQDWLRRDIGFRRSLLDTTYVKRSVYRSAIMRACSRLTWFDGGEIQTKEREWIPVVLGDLLDTYGRDYLVQRHPEDEDIDFDDTVEQELQAGDHDLGVKSLGEADYAERQGGLSQNLTVELQESCTSSSNGSERSAAYVDINDKPSLKHQQPGRLRQSQVRPRARASPSPKAELPRQMILTNPATKTNRTAKDAEKGHPISIFSQSRQQSYLLQPAPLTPVNADIQSTRSAQELDDPVIQGERSSGTMEETALVRFEERELDDDFASVGVGRRTVQDWRDEVNEVVSTSIKLMPSSRSSPLTHGSPLENNLNHAKIAHVHSDRPAMSSQWRQSSLSLTSHKKTSRPSSTPGQQPSTGKLYPHHVRGKSDGAIARVLSGMASGSLLGSPVIGFEGGHRHHRRLVSPVGLQNTPHMLSTGPVSSSCNGKLHFRRRSVALYPYSLTSTSQQQEYLGVQSLALMASRIEGGPHQHEDPASAPLTSPGYFGLDHYQQISPSGAVATSVAFAHHGAVHNRTSVPATPSKGMFSHQRTASRVSQVFGHGSNLFGLGSQCQTLARDMERS